jgi:2-dehydro-3-deoxyphosphogluconate aldolase/(4S)-4-hydroxy-2-oxoglutarate aldolase
MAAVKGGVVGAGTLMTPADVIAAKEAGATFGVSPGATDRLLDACEDADLPLLPGVASATEAMRLLERGYDVLKFFPAEAAGGAPALCAGGSWVAPKQMVESGDWAGIEALAKEAAAL